jgi:hypothetical protein
MIEDNNNRSEFSKKQQLTEMCENLGIRVKGNESVETLELFIRLEKSQF